LKHSIWTRNYFSTIFAISRIYSKVEKGFLKKSVGQNQAGLGGTAPGQPIPVRERAGGWRSHA
jgi:hypothetical protein